MKHHNTKPGAVSVLAMLFVCLFAVLATSFTAMSNTNIQTAVSHRDIVQAQVAAESGLAYVATLLDCYIDQEQPGTYEQSFSQAALVEVFTNFQSYAASLLEGSPVTDGESIGSLTTFSEDGLTGRRFSIPSIQVSPGSSDHFSLLL